MQHKSALWYGDQTSCLSVGQEYNLDLDFTGVEDKHAILSFESLCHCQLLKNDLRGDVCTIENCMCDGYWYTATRPLPISNNQSVFGLVCIDPQQGDKVYVTRMPYYVNNNNGEAIYVFCIPRSDAYFYSKDRSIPQAFSEFLTM